MKFHNSREPILILSIIPRKGILLAIKITDIPPETTIIIEVTIE